MHKHICTEWINGWLPFCFKAFCTCTLLCCAALYCFFFFLPSLRAQIHTCTYRISLTFTLSNFIFLSINNCQFNRISAYFTWFAGLQAMPLRSVLHWIYRVLSVSKYYICISMSVCVCVSKKISNTCIKCMAWCGTMMMHTTSLLYISDASVKMVSRHAKQW